MGDKKDRGLELEVSINDGACAIAKGISRVYPDIEIQYDVFHAIHEIGKEVNKAERMAYGLMKQEHNYSVRAQGKRPQEKTKVKLAEIKPKVENSIMFYDTLFILFAWFRELLGFSGYTLEETTLLIEFVLQEMETAAADSPSLLAECARIRKILPSLLSFIRRLTGSMEQRAQELGIPPEVFPLMYHQLRYSKKSRQYNELEYQIVMMLMNNYDNARLEFERLLVETKKASSLVENLNGRIRVYINIKRVIPTRFFVLLKVYFNTRCYRRSRLEERVGKSPLELLTGKPGITLFEALGF